MGILRFLIPALLALACAACSDNRPTHAPVAVPAERPTVSELQESVRAAVPLKPKWSSIQAEDAGAARGSFKVAVIYNTMPSGHAEIERDTKEVAAAALAALIKAGRSPSQEGLYLSVWARKPETGVTGQPLVRIFGKSSYNASNDSIEYERFK